MAAVGPALLGVQGVSAAGILVRSISGVIPGVGIIATAQPFNAFDFSSDFSPDFQPGSIIVFPTTIGALATSAAGSIAKTTAVLMPGIGTQAQAGLISTPSAANVPLVGALAIQADCAQCSRCALWAPSPVAA